jgi:LmbE family N-acetylglucosaminyl deacetylase
MERAYLDWTMEEFFQAAQGWKSSLFLMPHQDDEFTYAGLMQRLLPGTRIVWFTNGDGLFFEMNVTPEECGRIRMSEGVNAVGAIGVREKNTGCLAFSEVEIYRQMSFLQKDPGLIKTHVEFWDAMRLGVRDALFAARPDAVFTSAWQGGHPEHDLTHYFTRLAVDDYERETGRALPFFHLPAYEYTVLIAFRFHPFYKGRRLRFALTPREMEGKRRMSREYHSQADMMVKFRKFLDRLGLIGGLFGFAGNADEYLGVEHLGPVPHEMDYSKSTHFFDKANYMFEDFQGIPITFKRCIRPVVETFPRKPL